MPNAVNFRLMSRDAPEIVVDRVDASPEKLGRGYRYHITLRTPGGLDDDLMGVPGLLTLALDGRCWHYHGFITELCETGERYRCVMVDPLQYQLRHVRNGSYHTGSVTEVLQQLLQQQSLPAAIEKFAQVYLRKAFWCQYQTSDYDYWQWLCCQYGVVWGYQQDENQWRIVVTDDVNALVGRELTLHYSQQQGLATEGMTIYAVQYRQQLLPDIVVLNDINYRKPRLDLMLTGTNATSVPGCGTVSDFGANYQTIAEGQLLLRARLVALDCEREYFTGITHGPVSLGDITNIEGHPDAHFNQTLRVIGQRWCVTQQHSRNAIAVQFRNELQCIPAQREYCVAPFKSPQPDFAIATIVGESQDYPSVDNQGRYRVRYDFLPKDSPPSHPVRLNQPLAGNEAGMHFPLRAGTKVIVAGINGQLSRPVVMGVVNDSAYDNPVTANNAEQHILRSAKGQQCVLQDGVAPEVRLNNKDNTVMLAINPRAIVFSNQHGRQVFSAALNHLVRSLDNYSCYAAGNYQQQVGEFTLQTGQAALVINARESIVFESNGDGIFTAPSINVVAGNSLAISIGNGCVLNSMDNFTMTFGNGACDIHVCDAATIIAEERLSLQQGGGSLICQADKLHLKAPCIRLQAKAIVVANGCSQLGA